MKALMQQACLAALLSLCVPSSQAAAISDISIQDLHFDLVDLTPNDGLAPGFVPPEDAKAYTGGFGYFDQTIVQQGYSAFLQPFHLDDARPEGHIDLQVSPSVISARTETGTASEVNGVINVYTGNSFITLLPYSALHITGLVSSTVQSDGAVVGNMTYVGSVFLGLNFYGTASGGGQLNVNLENHPSGVAETLNDQKPIDFLLQNNSGTSKTIQIDLDMGAYGHLVPRAVPEPETWALVLGGLLTVAGGLRMRRRVSSSPSQ